MVFCREELAKLNQSKAGEYTLKDLIFMFFAEKSATIMLYFVLV